VDLETLSGRRAYYRQVQLVLQNSRASFNPRRRLRSTVEAARRALAPDLPDSALSEACELVGLPPALLDRFPHEISGGQAQRAALVRALSVKPSVLVLDEPAASLDATLKQKLVAALANVQGALGVACLFITHELSLVALVAEDVLLMHEGRIVERGPTEQVLSAPTSEHGRLLLELTPRLSL
jgi:ABC-type dipeptide/oligopeptide/nickel transport system ATPase subunit